jgi:hypothetical protein
MKPTRAEMARASGHKHRDLKIAEEISYKVRAGRDAEADRRESHRKFSQADMDAAVEKFTKDSE